MYDKIHYNIKNKRKKEKKTYWVNKNKNIDNTIYMASKSRQNYSGSIEIRTEVATYV